MNWYAYVGNDPVNLNDPDGRRKKGRGVGMVYLVADIGEATGLITSKQAKSMRKIADASQGKIRNNKKRAEDFSPKVKKEIRAEQKDCQKCGTETVSGVADKKGVPPAGNRSEIHHIKQVQDGGKGNKENAENLCHDCHVDEHKKLREEAKVKV